MSGYTKVFGSILDSSIWQESKETRLVWLTMLIMSDRDGFVNASLPGLADRAKVTLDECKKALELFASPDPYSRTKSNDGRRIQEMEGGWLILNHAKYREKLSLEERRDYWRKKKQDAREKEKQANRGLSAREVIRGRVEADDALREPPPPYSVVCANGVRTP